MFCPKCGSLVADGARFCGKCGTPMRSTGASTPAAGYQTDQTQQGYQQGYAQQGYQQDFQTGYQQDYAQQGYQSGYQQDYAQQGYQAGYAQPGYQQGYQQDYGQQNYQQGYQQAGYQQGYAAQDQGTSYGYAQSAQTAPVDPVPSQPYNSLDLGGGPRRIREDRSLIILVLLSIVTCGIYSYWNIYSIAQDMNTMCDDDQNTDGLLVYILLSFITCGFYSLYWEYKIGDRIAANAPRFGISVMENGTTILMWRVLGLLLCVIGTYYGEYLLLKNINVLAHAYNQQHGFI